MGTLVRGDYNGDGRVNIVDVVLFGKYLFGGEVEPPVNIETMDVNGDGKVNVTDYMYLVNYLFNDGPAPVPFK